MNELSRWNRILVYGHTGAGKSTLSLQLREKLNLPIIHFDRLAFEPGWVRRRASDLRLLVEEACRGAEWIVDGAYGEASHALFERADVVIFLDFPRWLCTIRLLRRWLRHRGRTRPDLQENCPDRLTYRLVTGTLFYPRHRLLERLAFVSADCEVVRLRGPRDVATFVSGLEALGRFGLVSSSVGDRSWE